MSKTLGERNNNPGCISPAGRVKRYENLTDGYHALFKLLRDSYNNKTALEIFNRYAPEDDGNNPTAYAQFVIDHLKKKGFEVNHSTRLDFISNPDLLIETAIAISIQENSKVLCPPEYPNSPEEYVCAQAASFYQSINGDLNRVFTDNGINITNPTTNPNTQTNNQNEQNHHKNTPSPTPTPSTNPLGAAGDQMINSLIQSVIMLALTKYMNK